MEGSEKMSKGWYACHLSTVPVEMQAHIQMFFELLSLLQHDAKKPKTEKFPSYQVKNILGSGQLRYTS